MHSTPESDQPAPESLLYIIVQPTPCTVHVLYTPRTRTICTVQYINRRLNIRYQASKYSVLRRIILRPIREVCTVHSVGARTTYSSEVDDWTSVLSYLYIQSAVSHEAV